MIHKASAGRHHRKPLRDHAVVEVTAESDLRFIQVPSSYRAQSFAATVVRGLANPFKELPSRLFYDVTGSRLFEQITRLPEYYLTRCETEILERYSSDIIAQCGTHLQVVEFGSGSSEKTRLLLRAAAECQPGVEYVPIDISAEFLRDSARELLDEVVGLRVTALGGDYLDALHALPVHSGSRLFLFLGSTIGNFEQFEAVAFLSEIRRTMRPQDRLLVGVDLKKQRQVIEPAYNDAQGVTEQFNKNMLVRINRELCGHFDLDSFRHEAPWIEEGSRIEMRLVSKIDQEVCIDGIERWFSFKEGEFIHTENSHKWSPEVFAAMCGRAGLELGRSWLDPRGWFSLNLLGLSTG